MKKLIVILVFITVSQFLMATEFMFDLYTYHPKIYGSHTYDYNNHNNLIGIEHNNFVLSLFTNSYYDTTVSLSYNLYKDFGDCGKCYLGTGLAYGYKKYYDVDMPNGDIMRHKVPYMIGDKLSLVTYVGYDYNGVNLIVFPVGIKVLYKIKIF